MAADNQASPAAGTDEEKQAQHDASTGSSRFSRKTLTGPVTKEHGDLPLLMCCLCTGLVDAAMFSNWGVFAGMQTGNTVILGISTAGLPSNPHAWLTTLVSISSFLAGARTAFTSSKWITPKGIYTNRAWLATIFLAQSLLILLSAALATPSGLIPQNPGPHSRNQHEPEWVLNDVMIVSLISPLAFQSGMQIAGSRLLGYNELPVNVLTSTYCDIMGDFQLLALNNVKRNRRVLAVVLLLVGAISAGWLMRTSGGLCSVLWLAGGLKFLIAVGIVFFMPAAGTKDPGAPRPIDAASNAHG